MTATDALDLYRDMVEMPDGSLRRVSRSDMGEGAIRHSVHGDGTRGLNRINPLMSLKDDSAVGTCCTCPDAAAWPVPRRSQDLDRMDDHNAVLTAEEAT